MVVYNLYFRPIKRLVMPMNAACQVNILGIEKETFVKEPGFGRGSCS